MNTPTIPKSRTELLARISRAHGTVFLLDAIHESGVGISAAFTDADAMNQVIRTARRMLAEKKGAGTSTNPL